MTFSFKWEAGELKAEMCILLKPIETNIELTNLNMYHDGIKNMNKINNLSKGSHGVPDLPRNLYVEDWTQEKAVTHIV